MCSGLSLPGIPKQALPGGRIGSHPVGLEESQGLLGRQPVSGSSVPEPKLQAAFEGAQSARHREPEDPQIQEILELKLELPHEEESPGNPGLLASEDLPHRRGCEAVLVHERCDDARLVHGAQCPPRRVGAEEARLERGSGGRLHDDRDLRAALLLPALEALEAVDDLVRSALELGDPQRQLGKRRSDAAAHASQAAKRGPQPLDGNKEDLHFRTRSRLRIWYRG